MNKFVKLFDMSPGDGADVDVDSALTSSANSESFESISEEDNMKKFHENMAPHKEELGSLKELPMEKAAETTEIIEKPEEVEESKQGDPNELQEPENKKDEEVVKDEDLSDNSDSGDENIVDNTDQNSGDKVKMDSLNKTITTHLTNFDWQFENSSPRFENFYKEKKRLVERITQGELIPFEAYRNELRQAKVDVSTVDYDFKAILEKMKEVQSWRDRVQEISSRINRQFFLWKRFIDLIHGYLALVAYEKPAEKFKGVIYQHLGDVEMYLGELESTRDGVEGVLKNLDGASNVLSRQLTMMMGSKDAPTIYGSNEQYASPKSEEPPQVIRYEVTMDSKESVDLSLKNDVKKNERLGQFDSINSPQDKTKTDIESKCGIVDWSVE